MFCCWHLYQSLTVSSVVGAPWRCGVLTTQGGIAGIGLGRLLGRDHASTPQSGVEVPRLRKRASPDCIVVVLETALDDVSVHTAQNTDLQRQFHN